MASNDDGIAAGTPTRIYRDAVQGIRGHTLDRVPCGSCVACCRSDFPVPLTKEECRRFPSMLDEITGRRVLQRVGRDCIMFDAEQNRCSVYADRPQTCRIYDCRQQYLAGMRNTGKGLEINERVEQWRTEARDNLDLGIIWVVWSQCRKWLQMTNVPDVGPAVAYGIAQAAVLSEPELRSIGRIRGEEARAILRILNGEEAAPAERLS